MTAGENDCDYSLLSSSYVGRLIQMALINHLTTNSDLLQIDWMLHALFSVRDPFGLVRKAQEAREGQADRPA